MFVYGYKKSKLRTFICYLCVGLTLGILRLVMHWWNHWLLLATHKPCSLEEAEKVLLKEKFQGKHSIYYVKTVITLTTDSIRYVAKIIHEHDELSKLPIFLLLVRFSDVSKKAELEACFSERFIECSGDEFYRQLEIHLSDGNFQRK